MISLLHRDLNFCLARRPSSPHLNPPPPFTHMCTHPPLPYRFPQLHSPPPFITATQNSNSRYTPSPSSFLPKTSPHRCQIPSNRLRARHPPRRTPHRAQYQSHPLLTRPRSTPPPSVPFKLHHNCTALRNLAAKSPRLVTI